MFLGVRRTRTQGKLHHCPGPGEGRACESATDIPSHHTSSSTALSIHLCTAFRGSHLAPLKSSKDPPPLYSAPCGAVISVPSFYRKTPKATSTPGGTQLESRVTIQVATH